METNDPIVTLLDGTKCLKSAVPVGIIYINENGQQVKKIIKHEPQPAKSSFIQRVGYSLGNAGKVVGQAVSVAANVVGDNAKQAANSAKDAMNDKSDEIANFATAKIKSIVARINFDETLSALDKYSNESGKDVAELRNFIVELQKFSQDGSR